MASSVNSDMFICARVVTGLGIGFINAIIPPWVSELSQAHDRGSSFSLVFVANYLGIVIAYWINFGIRSTNLEFRWRFPLAWMVIPLLIVNTAIPFLPESPRFVNPLLLCVYLFMGSVAHSVVSHHRWLIANGKRSQAVDILCKLRGDLSPEDPIISVEVAQLDAIVEETQHERNKLFNIALGGRHSGSLHLGRRAVMGFALQWIQQWTGILAIAAWAGTLFHLAGFDSYKSMWLAGLVNTFGVPGTAAAALVIDRMGRIKSLITSFITQGISLFLVAAFIKTSQDAAAAGDMGRSTQLGTAAASFVFIYIWLVAISIFCYLTSVSNYLSIQVFHDVQYCPVLDLWDGDLAAGNPCQGLQLHHLRLGRWLWYDTVRHSHHARPPRLGNLRVLRRDELRCHAHHLLLLSRSG